MIERSCYYVTRNKIGQVYTHYDSLDEALKDIDSEPDIETIEKRTTTFEREVVWSKQPKVLHIL